MEDVGRDLRPKSRPARHPGVDVCGAAQSQLGRIGHLDGNEVEGVSRSYVRRADEPALRHRETKNTTSSWLRPAPPAPFGESTAILLVAALSTRPTFSSDSAPRRAVA